MCAMVQAGDTLPFWPFCVTCCSMLVQGHHSKCGPADLLLSPPDNSQRSPRQQKLCVAVLAPLHDECPEWPFVGWLRTGKQCRFVERMCMFLLFSLLAPSS